MASFLTQTRCYNTKMTYVNVRNIKQYTASRFQIQIMSNIIHVQLLEDNNHSLDKGGDFNATIFLNYKKTLS